MAKPGREFEEAVYRFAKTLDLGAEVIFDYSARDRDTGESRQCDVWINAKLGGHLPISVLVSCKDHSRKLHVGDIGSFFDEVRSTSASTGVIYSRNGFTKPALAKAKANGLACCRLYLNEPADIPLSICFHQFVCKPAIELALVGEANQNEFSIWNDVFDSEVRAGQENRTILDEISAAYEKGEKWSINQFQAQGSQKVFPPEWSMELPFSNDETSDKIIIRVTGRWKKYKAKLEATLLNGSYCFTDSSFKGDAVGPSIDTQGMHPGPAWQDVNEADSFLPLSRLTFILSRPDVKKTLLEIGKNDVGYVTA